MSKIPRTPTLEDVFWFLFDLKVTMGTEYAQPWRFPLLPDFPNWWRKEPDVPIREELVRIYYTLPEESAGYVQLLLSDALRSSALMDLGLWETLTILDVAYNINHALVTPDVLHVLLTRPYHGDSQPVLVGMILRRLVDWDMPNMLTTEEWCRVANVIVAPDTITLIWYQQKHVSMTDAECERFHAILRTRTERG